MDSNQEYKYIVYKTTNIINNKIYIGIHKTKNPNDEYIGSGIMLKRAIGKYGIENFKKENLFIFNSAELMFDKEAEIVDRVFLESENTYNIALGGRGSWDYANKSDRTAEWCKNLSISKIKEYSIKKHPWSGRKHKESSKKKIGKVTSVAQRGSGNSQYGKCWIYSEQEQISKSIKKEDASSFLNSGWNKGRRMFY